MSTPLPKLAQIPSSLASVADYEPLARERVTQAAWAYVSGGAADELTLRENEAAFRRLRLRSRVLEDLAGGGTGLTLFGQSLDYPILLAPVAFQRLVHPDGELATALGAAAIGAGMVVSTQASVTLEEIARRSSGPLWFQLYVQPDRGFTRELVRRAEDAGYQALMVTVDSPVSGMRNREQRAGFVIPSDIDAANLRGMTAPMATGLDAGPGMLLGGPLLAAAPTWRDLDWLRSLTRLPLIVKGIMTEEDAARAIDHGAEGIVVSNHGGRTLDGQPASIEALPAVVAAVNGRAPVLLDGGIRRGSDAFKALALGAAAVMIGRPYIYGLAAAGAVGVAHVLRILRAELEVTMALTGCTTLGAIGPAALFDRS